MINKVFDVSPFQSGEHQPLTGRKRLRLPLNGGQAVLRVRGGGGNGGQGGGGWRGAQDGVGGSVHVVIFLPQNYIHQIVYLPLLAYPQIGVRAPRPQDHVNGEYEGQIMMGERLDDDD